MTSRSPIPVPLDQPLHTDFWTESHLKCNIVGFVHKTSTYILFNIKFLGFDVLHTKLFFSFELLLDCAWL